MIGVGGLAQWQKITNLLTKLEPWGALPMRKSQQVFENAISVGLDPKVNDRVTLVQFGFVNIDLDNLCIRRELSPVETRLLEAKACSQSNDQV